MFMVVGTNYMGGMEWQEGIRERGGVVVMA